MSLRRPGHQKKTSAAGLAATRDEPEALTNDDLGRTHGGGGLRHSLVLCLPPRARRLGLLLLLLLLLSLTPLLSRRAQDEGPTLRTDAGDAAAASSDGASRVRHCDVLERCSPSTLSSLTSLDLSACNLTRIPPAVRHCTSLTFLDVSDNPGLKTFPPELAQCTSLDTLFSSRNVGMTELPAVLGSMESLTRLGWKSGRIEVVRGGSVPPNVVHFILTDNRISSFGGGDGRNGSDDGDEGGVALFRKLGSVRKLMLSHNRIRRLSPEGTKLLRSLELVRLSNNDLVSVPDELWELPKLAWTTISGNPRLGLPKLVRTVPLVAESDLGGTGEDGGGSPADGGTFLGAGASGSVTSRSWNGRDVAVKVIRGVTSDGKAEDELEIFGAVGPNGTEHNVAGCLGLLVRSSDGDGRDAPAAAGAVMPRLPPGLVDLADPPTIVEVTADRWEGSAGRSATAGPGPFPPGFVLRALTDASEALRYLHDDVGVAHGDFYAHNAKVDPATGRLHLLDFGASYVKGRYASRAERVEVRAFGVLVTELLDRIEGGREGKGGDGKADFGLRSALSRLRDQCTLEDVSKRPTFQQIADRLADMRSELDRSSPSVRR